MNGKADRVEVNGQLFEYVKDEPVQEVKIKKLERMTRRSTVTYPIPDKLPTEGTDDDDKADELLASNLAGVKDML